MKLPHSEMDEVNRSNRLDPDTIELVREVMQVFLRKNWSVGGEAGDVLGPFDRTLSMLAHMDKDETRLLIALLDRFVRIELDQYPSALAQLAQNIRARLDPQKVVIVPIKSIRDHNRLRANSGELVNVLMRTGFANASVVCNAFTDLRG